MARDRPSPYGNEKRLFRRSAGACPPRTFRPNVYIKLTRCDQAIATYRGSCSLARDRPSPYGNATWFLWSGEGNPFACAFGMARDRPSPYGNEKRLFRRSAGACPPRTFRPNVYIKLTRCDQAIATYRGSCGIARDRPSPYGNAKRFFRRSAGACPPEPSSDSPLRKTDGDRAPSVKAFTSLSTFCR